MSFSFEYELVRSDRRTLSVEIKRGGRVLVRAPRMMPLEDIEAFLSKRTEWIEKHVKKSQARQAAYDPDRFTSEDIKALKAKAREVIPTLVDRYKVLLGVEPSAVKINSAKGRFGSCSGKNSLNFSCFLMLYPIQAIEYVVVHELCHIKEHNHSRRFYSHIERIMPDCKYREKLLKNSMYEGGVK